LSKEPIGKYLSIARRAHATLLDKELGPYDISHGQILLLATLYNQDGICQRTLCQMYNLNKAAVGRGLTKLENKEYITRQTDPQDQRKNLIYLTNKAHNFEKKFKEVLDSSENKLSNNLSAEEIETFLTVIKKICSNLGANVE
jgi:DNA-binding MarR family transcriptional regulator